MAPVSSDVQSGSADTPEHGARGHSGATAPAESGSAVRVAPDEDRDLDFDEADPDPGPDQGLDEDFGDDELDGEDEDRPLGMRSRIRAGRERGRVWMRPNREPRPDERPPVRERLVPPFYPEFFRGASWILPLLVTAVGGFMRFWKLGTPNHIIFDETYYAKDAWSMTVYGWEHTWQPSATADPALVPPGGSSGFGQSGRTLFGQGPEYVVHPPIGKWLIGAGERFWGLNPVGWRLMEAVLGTLAILIITRTARRLFRSTLLGCVAGLLMSFDGLSFVMARTALLDGIQMFFILAGFSCLLADRDRVRAKFADWREDRGSALIPRGDFGPKLGLRPWRLLAGLSLGLASATKWNGVFFLIAFSILTVLWDRGARHAVGVRRPSLAALARDVPWAFLSVPVVAVATFVASYAGWFINTSDGGGYNRFWAQSHPSDFWPTWTDPFRSLWNYVDQQYAFNVNLQTTHPYMSTPWSWLIMGRPVAFDYASPKPGTPGCTAQMGGCSQEVLALGTPLLWWFASATILYLLWRWIGRRDWRAGAILCGLAAGILPWMHYAERTIFSFYAVSFAPFMILSATMGIGAILGRADAEPNRRAWGAAVAGTLVIGIVGMFIFFYPIYTDTVISYAQWSNRMWLQSWI
jgi:dolichyl-phosphate-mannose-protein mannosyltransferase